MCPRSGPWGSAPGQLPQDGEAGVEDGQAQHQEGDGEGDDGVGLEQPLDGDGGQHEAQEGGAGVPMKILAGFRL